MTGKALDGAKGSPLRQRTIEHMRIADPAESTHVAYLFEIERLARIVRPAPRYKPYPTPAWIEERRTAVVQSAG